MLFRSIELLESIQEKNKSIYKTLCKYNLFRNDYERARKIYNDYIKNDKEIFCDILSKEGNYSEALRIIEEKHNENEYNEMLIVAKSFYYLKLNRYKDAKDLTFKYLNKNQHKSGPMLINYHLALKLEGKTIDRKKIEEKIINNKNSNEILKAAGYALLDDKNNAIKNIKKAIKEDYSEFYIIQDWEVFKNINSSEYRQTYILQQRILKYNS